MRTRPWPPMPCWAKGLERSHEYIDALARTQNYRAAAEAAHAVYRQTKDPAVLRKYLRALSRYDTPSSLEAYATHIGDGPDNDILFDYILLQKSNGNFAAALDATRSLLATSGDPVHRLCECDLLGGTGQDAKALAAYRTLDQGRTYHQERSRTAPVHHQPVPGVPQETP